MELSRILAVIAVMLTASAAIAAQSETRSDAPEATTSPAQGSALAHWQQIYEVFSHPRCANCHVPEDNRPRWSGPSYGLGEGEWTYHGMNIDGDESRIGAESIPCFACHASTNSELPHGPPGAPVWLLAPVEMVWWEKTSQEICEQIKDPARNGGRTLQQVADHISHDELVHWGWAPGPGREPAPYSVAETVAAFEAWIALGAPCPGSE